MSKLSKNLTVREITCKCGCGFDKINPKVVETFQTIRDLWGKPIVITSACRCAKHNKRVGGSPKSQHMLGNALDMVTSGGAVAFHDFIQAMIRAKKLPYVGMVILYKDKNFVHVDVRGK
jgi:uncharacterized protein YcbK (DUF882 family)